MHISSFFHSARKMQFCWKIDAAAARHGRLEFPSRTRFMLAALVGGLTMHLVDQCRLGFGLYTAWFGLYNCAG